MANGGFETGDFSGWTQFGNTDPFYSAVDTLLPHDGDYAACFGPPTTDTGGISQSLATVANQSYVVSYWLQSEADVNGVDKANSLQPDWNGVTVAPASISDANAFGCAQYSFTLLATSASTDLRFTFGHDPACWDLDTVSVTPPPTRPARSASARASRPPPRTARSRWAATRPSTTRRATAASTSPASSS